jgi:hypothetical protein
LKENEMPVSQEERDLYGNNGWLKKKLCWEEAARETARLKGCKTLHIQVAFSLANQVLILLLLCEFDFLPLCGTRLHEKYISIFHNLFSKI